MGIATPVLWTCARCANPPVLVGLWRSLKGKCVRTYNKARYLLTTTAEYRAKRTAAFAKAKARINERRLARGEPLIGEA